MRKRKNKILKAIIIIIILALIVYLVKYFYDKNQAQKSSKLLEKIQVSEQEITEEKTERMIQVSELKKENSDIVGWIEIEGTNINYPVLQATNNDYYMKKDYKKQYNYNGSIFLDSNYDWNLPSTNLLIYGHNNLNDCMFAQLLNYKDENFYKEHTKMRFTTEVEDAEYEIIAAFFSKVYYKTDKNVFKYYYFINAETETEFNEYIENSKKASIYDTGITAEYGDQLITLSTCSYHTEDGRFAVVAKKTSK